MMDEDSDIASCVAAERATRRRAAGVIRFVILWAAVCAGTLGVSLALATTPDEPIIGWLFNLMAGAMYVWWLFAILAVASLIATGCMLVVVDEFRTGGKSLSRSHPEPANMSAGWHVGIVLLAIPISMMIYGGAAFAILMSMEIVI